MRTHRHAGRRRHALGAMAVCAALITTGAVSSTSATGSSFDPCPEPFPATELAEGMQATGYTVEKGTEPEPFTATVVGVVEDGIGPDADMIVVETDSPAIERAGGIWSGMSGSPVYASDGRLIGAVAYGFSSAPSKIAGLTPAADMVDMLDLPGSSMSTTRPGEPTVALPGPVQERLVSSGSVTADQVTSGMRRLPLPLAVSGLHNERLTAFDERMEAAFPGVHAYPAGAADPGESSEPTEIVPGGNVAAGVAYGDVTSAAVGTTTAVCQTDRVLAFGHPSLWSGATTMSMHPAEAVFVQRDDTFGSFKVANPRGVVGTFDQDRLAGVRGQLDGGPAVVPITSTVRSAEHGTSRDGTTSVTVADALPDMASFHVLANIDAVFDRIGAGTAEIGWTIEGTRSSGAPFELDVTNMYASTRDIAFESVGDSVEHVRAIQENEVEDVTVTGVTYDVNLSAEFTRYSVDTLLVGMPDGTTRTSSQSSPLPVAPGDELDLRVELAPYQGIGGQETVELTLQVPSDAPEGVGQIEVIGGAESDDQEFGDNPDGNLAAKDFDELLATLEDLEPNNSVTGTLNVTGADGARVRELSSERVTVDQIVVGMETFPIEVVVSDD
ncbi:hypothetical protein EF847_20125 [Actinobacteria bacterium YIM 96077]|uniref:Peptidase S55 domain-containing protein n=1 Tax=Phytoactinopolyspora halophila TaxID=1981511 RepID=A0A329QGY5_9ACTN|nr:SpoIVB peptidase S55 domain-containing protein [Phytoactinopolyspora halophila]AYY14655.1 hypothetical protein EF847_20125 [Actinobacteria bacterium YIM 96077]RAW11634.1 hypothetical protein DPM12_16325 [Phytoactinopolyspora halophila]